LPELVSKIRGSDLYAQANTDQDAVQLLLIIWGYCCSFDANQQSMFALEGAKHRVQVFIQGYDVTVMDYVEYFMALVGVVKTYGGAYGNEPGLLREQLTKQGVSAADVDKTIANRGPDAAEIKKALVVTHKCYLSCMILRGSDNSRFYQVKTDLQNDMTKGTNNFTKTVVQTTCLLSNYKVPPRHVCAREPDSKGVPYLDVRDAEAEVALSFIQTTIGAVEAAMVAPAWAVSFVQTVHGNMEGYTQREVEDSRATREAQAMLGHPTDRNFLGMVRSGMILNCPVNPSAVQNANRIFGPDLAGVRG
jgi:hypothetical protein